MTNLYRIIHTSAFAGLFLASSLVQAGTQTSVIVGPASVNVPTLNGSMLVALGLLLAVIAVRVLRSKQGTHRLLSWLVLGVGLIVGGIGVQRSEALTSGSVTAEGAVCAADGPVFYNPLGDVVLNNACSNRIEIKSFSVPINCTLETDAGCKQGQVLEAGASCSFLPRCTS